MAITPTLRFLLKQYGSGGDPHPNRAEFNAMIDSLENNAAMFSQGITGARPAAGKRGRFYYDETVDRLYYDNGAAWKDANPNGGGGAGRALAIGAAGIEGTSARAARADHTHPLPLATAADPGAMSASDKAKLDGSTSAATADAIARRDASGRIAVGTPTAGGHATTKTYVDGRIQETADYIDGISTVCTSTTRPAKAPGLRIFETDTKRVMFTDGTKWYIDYSPYAPYTPTWIGFQNLGLNYISEGEWAWIGPETVRMSARLVAGSGGLMGTGRLYFSLPVPVASTAFVQNGSGVFAFGGIQNPHRAIITETGSGANACEMWNGPGSNGFYSTLGSSGWPFGQGTEIHVALTYKAEQPA